MRLRMNAVVQRKAALTLLLSLATMWLVTGCQGVKFGEDRRVLVMDFQSSELALDKYSKSLPELFTASLANYPRVGVLERQDVQSSDLRYRYQWRRVGREVGAHYLLIGSINKLDENYIINARLYSIGAGQIVKGSSTTRACTREEDIYPAVQAISRIMARHLNVLAERYDAIARGGGYGVSPYGGRDAVEPASEPGTSAIQ